MKDHLSVLKENSLSLLFLNTHVFKKKKIGINVKLKVYNATF